MAKSPMLADHESVHHYPDALTFPLYASPKLDGIRCVISGGRAVTRTFLDMPNNFVRKALSVPELEGLDGELVVGPPTAENVYNLSTGVLGNKIKEPAFTFHVFDDFTDPAVAYNERQVRLCERLLDLCGRFPLEYVEPTRIQTWEGLEAYEDMILGRGYEGVITRLPKAAYKFGRSTKNQQGMLKLKRFTDGEAEIIGFEELMRNSNPDLRDNFGHAKRSKAQAGLVPGGTLGKLQCRDLVSGVEFQIGMFKGLTSEDKQRMWDTRDELMGKLVKYQHLAHGAIDKPRHSKFLGFRERSDM